MVFQELIRKLNDYWAAQGCAMIQPYDLEVGASTLHPATALRCLGPNSWRAANVQASRRPTDGRYTRNPMRSQRYYQYQVILKPSPENVVELYMDSLKAIGLDLYKNDIRLVEDDWENPSLGAGGVGWEVWLNGTEISQFTFFQQMGGIECHPVSAELTYGTERLCLVLNHGNSFWEDLQWNEQLSYRDMEWQAEMQNNIYNFEVASTSLLTQLFESYEAESKRVLETEVFWDDEQQIMTTNPLSGEGKTYDPSYGPLALVHPALDLALKCSHIFNILDARGVVSPTERAVYINRIRTRVRACCLRYLEQFENENSKKDNLISAPLSR